VHLDQPDQYSNEEVLQSCSVDYIQFEDGGNCVEYSDIRTAQLAR
jgi:hypothetical protein